MTEQLAWEQVGPWEHVSERDFAALRSRPYFQENWNRSDYGRMYPLIETCMWRDFSYGKTMSVIRLWNKKHGRDFDEDEFWRIYMKVGDRQMPISLEWKANDYWKGVREIQFNLKKRAHTKMRVAYYLLNKSQGTASEIAEATGISIKNVRLALANLVKSGKLEQFETGIYRAISSFTWDAVNVLEDGSVWDEEHPALLELGVSPNERHGTKMRVWDYVHDRSVTVDSQGYELEFEWVLDHSGNVVVNGNAVYRISSKTAVPADEDFDFLAALEESVSVVSVS